MKILHLMLACFYIDNYSYQENLLPKYHKLLGHDVEIIASLFTFDKNGRGTWLAEGSKYVNEYGIPVTRLEYSSKLLSKRLRVYKGFQKEIKRIHPDLIFVHGVQFADISIVKAYCEKNPNTILYIDNHADFSNSATNFLSKFLLHQVVWKNCAQKILPHVAKFYGVLPARVDFLRNVYKLPANKTELLVMGGDDELSKRADQSRNSTRTKYKINEEDFLIVTGGKIDKWKTQTLLLMEAVKKINRDNVKLIVFGSVDVTLKKSVEALSDGNVVQYVGWVQSDYSYNLFAAADLAVFPGRHSVFWEQVASQGIPMMVKDWAGTHHIDMGKNVCFITSDTEDEIREKLLKIIDDRTLYSQMKECAAENKYLFSYQHIALKSIENRREE